MAFLDVHFKKDGLALASRKRGSKFFKRRSFREAMECYEESVRHALPDSKELALAYGNRSAVLYEIRLFKESITNIDLAIATYNFCGESNNLFKLHDRKARCFAQLKLERKANEEFSKCLHLLQESGLGDDAKQKWKARNSAFLEPVNEEIPATEKEENSQPLLPPMGIMNPQLPGACNDVEVQESKDRGKMIVAKNDVKAGEVIISQKAFAAVLNKEHFNVRCYHCFEFVSDNVFVPCQQCAQVRYCSTACSKASWHAYHEIECLHLNNLLSTAEFHFVFEEIPYYWQIALRVILTVGKTRIQGMMERDAQKPSVDDVDCMDEYDIVFNLESHQDKRTLPQSNRMAAKVFEILCEKKYFTNWPGDGKFSTAKVKAFVKRLLVKHVHQVAINSFSLAGFASKKFEESTIPSDGIVDIGMGLFATSSLLNHACDANVVRRNVGDHLTIRARVDVKSGEEFFTRYSTSFELASNEFRKMKLKKLYFFECRCKYCVDGGRAAAERTAYKCKMCEGPVPEVGSVCLDCHHPQRLTPRDKQDLDNANDCLELCALLGAGIREKKAHELVQCYLLQKKVLYKFNDEVRTGPMKALVEIACALGWTWVGDVFPYIDDLIELTAHTYGPNSQEVASALNFVATALCQGFWRVELCEGRKLRAAGEEEKFRQCKEKAKDYAKRGLFVSSLFYGENSAVIKDMKSIFTRYHLQL